MNRRVLVLGTTVAAIAAFGGAAIFYSRGEAGGPATTGPSDAFVRPHSPVIGESDARVTVVEFFDPSCEACRAFHPILKQILARHPSDVKLVLRYAAFHQGSDEAVRILEAARRQDRFEVVLQALYERQPEWAIHGAPNLENAWRIAGAAGLDVDQARRDARLPGVAQVLAVDMADVQALQVTRTPTFFVNGRPLVSFGPQQLYDLILSELRP